MCPGNFLVGSRSDVSYETDRKSRRGIQQPHGVMNLPVLLFDAHLLTGTSPVEVRVSAEDVRPRHDSAACIVRPDAAAPPCVSPRLDSHARRKSLKARARPSCRALDEQRVARRPTVPSVHHCPGADRARRHPPALLLIPSCQG